MCNYFDYTFVNYIDNKDAKTSGDPGSKFIFGYW